MRHMKSTMLCLVALLSLPGAAQACLAPALETRTFLDTLPTGAMQLGTVAKVEILSAILLPSGPSAQAQVIQPLKNVRLGQIFTVQMPGDGCALDTRFIARGQAYYIAGTLSGSGIFVGSWKHVAPKAADAP